MSRERFVELIHEVCAVVGLPDERLTIRHDAGSSAEPYVGGTLLATRRVMEVQGLVRGLDQLLFQA